MIGTIVSHYRIIDRLGGGGMGVVYKAEDTKLGRMVALKFLPPELTRDHDAKSRFLREARAASLLDHHNICTIYEIGDTEAEQTFIAMACYDGETLKSRIEREPLEIDEALKIAEEIARGLGKAHASGIIHRDIKPANVIVTTDGVAKILDFGLAKLAGATHITKSNSTLGTLAYMAPEQLSGDDVGPQADLWSLGMVLFELVTAKRPFQGDYDQAVAYSILNEQPASLAELRADAPPELDRVVKKMLRKDPLQRYQTAEEVIEELEILRTPSSGSGRSGSRTSTPRESLPAGARLGPYEIVEALGSGGMGDVYLARDIRLDRQVAIKVLAPEFSEDAERRQRFQREAKTISSLSHSNICTLFDVGEQEGVDYLVMEYLEGETLADRLTKGALPLSDLIRIGIQIGGALGAAHRQGVIHRDLKPGNVILTKTGAVKLVDFGLAKDLGAVTSAPRRPETPDKPLTAEGAIIGTLAYMAPEQVEGRESDARSDIFAFGAILYEMATGKRAFEGETKASLIAAILDREPPAITEVRADSDTRSGSRRGLTLIEHTIRRCLEKDPEQRWQNALDVANELRWVTEGGAETQTDSFADVPMPDDRWRRIALAMMVLVAVVAVGAYWLGRQARAVAPESEAPAIPPISRLVRLTWEEGRESEPFVSPDGNSFVYVSEASGNKDIYFRRIGGETSINLTKDSTEDDYSPAISPDGQTIAFRSDRDGGGVFLMGATGESVRRLTDFGHEPAWSPDGKTLAIGAEYSMAGQVTGTGGCFLVDAATGADKKLWEGSVMHPTWSPAGTRIAFQGWPKGGGQKSISTIAASGGEPVGVTPARGRYPMWTREGIVFSTAARSPLNLWRVRVDESTGLRIDEPVRVLASTGVNREPSTSADGRRLLFSSGDRMVRISQRGFDSVRGRAFVEDRTILNGPRILIANVRPSPDGVWLAALLSDQGQRDILLIRTSNGEARRLTNDSITENYLSWAPDSSKLYYSASPQGGFDEVWSIRPDGSGRERVVSVPGEHLSNGGSSPDGQSLYVHVGWSYVPHVVDLTSPPDERKLVPLPPIDEDHNLSWADSLEGVSPDGRWIKGWPLSSSSMTMNPTLTLFDVDRKTCQELMTLEGEWSDWDYQWLPDSRRILLFRRGGDRLQILDRQTGTISDGGSIEKGAERITLSSDGRSIFELRTSSEYDIWMLEYEEGP